MPTPHTRGGQTRQVECSVPGRLLDWGTPLSLTYYLSSSSLCLSRAVNSNSDTLTAFWALRGCPHPRPACLKSRFPGLLFSLQVRGRPAASHALLTRVLPAVHLQVGQLEVPLVAAGVGAHEGALLTALGGRPDQRGGHAGHAPHVLGRGGGQRWSATWGRSCGAAHRRDNGTRLCKPFPLHPEATMSQGWPEPGRGVEPVWGAGHTASAERTQCRGAPSPTITAPTCPRHTPSHTLQPVRHPASTKEPWVGASVCDAIVWPVQPLAVTHQARGNSGTTCCLCPSHVFPRHGWVPSLGGETESQKQASAPRAAEPSLF